MNLPKSVIMITLDCVRPDHIGHYGYKGVDTPNIDKIAEEGISFSQTIAQAPNTWVSHASIFTGCNPYNHGIRTPYTKLSDKVKTLAEVLSENGFATGGFPSHTLLGESQGFDRGFDLYDIDLNNFLHSSTAENNYFYRIWDNMWMKAKEWMVGQSKHFFIWLHYMGTHWEPEGEISLPPEYREKYSNYGQYYDGKISWADYICIGKVKEFLEKNKLSDDSILILFSDHGDDLSKNEIPSQYGGHNDNLFDDVMKILLVFRAPNRVPGNKIINKQVRSIDIMPTLLDIMGIPIPENIDGVSLVSLYDEEKKNKNSTTELTYMENIPRGWLGIRTEEYKLILSYKAKSESRKTNKNILNIINALFERFDRILFKNKKPIVFYKIYVLIFKAIKATYFLISKILRKLVLNKKTSNSYLSDELRIIKEGKVFALYNLKKDPGESDNIVADYSEVVNKLKSELVNMVKGSKQIINKVTDNEQKIISETLEKLGYY